MSLADLLEEEREVTAPNGKSVKVRPLTLEGVSLLLKHHGTELRALFEGKVEVDGLIKQSPGFAAALIASATGETSQAAVKIAMKLPIGLQLKILQEAWAMSAVDPEEVGKLLRGLIEGVTGMTAALKAGQTTSP